MRFTWSGWHRGSGCQRERDWQREWENNYQRGGQRKREIDRGGDRDRQIERVRDGHREMVREQWTENEQDSKKTMNWGGSGQEYNRWHCILLFFFSILHLTFVSTIPPVLSFILHFHSSASIIHFFQSLCLTLPPSYICTAPGHSIRIPFTSYICFI